MSNICTTPLLTIFQGAINEWQIQGNWQHWAHKTKDKKNKNKKATTQYVLDTTISQQLQIT
jgi:hypothetical protein